jgi:hypothetical protein
MSAKIIMPKEGVEPMPPLFLDDTEDALIAQVNWLRENLRVPDRFFANLLNTNEQTVRQWRARKGKLAAVQQGHLRELWQMMLHILSFLNFDVTRARTMLNHKSQRVKSFIRLPFDPPWLGTSLKAYLEHTGATGVREVDRWIQTVRFGNSY